MIAIPVWLLVVLILLASPMMLLLPAIGLANLFFSRRDG